MTTARGPNQTGQPAPKVSVIIPVYNDEACISRAVDSALAQTLASVEVVVVDDGSTDGTPEILTRYGDRIVRVRQRNHGIVAKARNVGVAASRGQYLCLLDSDDTIMPKKAELQSAFLDEHTGVGLCYSGWLDIDLNDGSVISDFSHARPESDPAKEVFPPHFPVFAALVRRDWFDLVGGLNERFKCVEDSDLWRRLWVSGCKFARVKGAMACRGVRPDSKSKNVPRHSKYAIAAFRLHFARVGARASRALRVRKLAGVWMKQAGHYINAGDTELAKKAIREALRYDRRLLIQPVNWAQLLRQMDRRFTPGEGPGLCDYEATRRQIVPIIREAMDVEAHPNREPLLREASAGLSYALSQHALFSGNILQSVKWAWRALVAGRGRPPSGIDWPLLRRALGRAILKIASRASRMLRRSPHSTGKSEAARR